MKNILLVEDEEHLSEIIKLNLELEGYSVTAVNNGRVAIETFDPRFDLIILDVMLPKVSGFDVCREIRSKNNDVPILFLTAKGEGEDRIKGLKLGADDYLSKPFNLEELLLRIANLLRRSKQSEAKFETEEYSFGNNSVNFRTFEIIDKIGQKHTLSKKEIQLLKLLISRKNEVVSRDEILDLIWGVDVYPSTRTIDNYILSFRKYFEDNPKEARFFHSIRGVGYKFTD
jgi:two-component system, OmpR family, alkaline phosphatase synthesis response regulator PhoP